MFDLCSLIELSVLITIMACNMFLLLFTISVLIFHWHKG